MAHGFSPASLYRSPISPHDSTPPAADVCRSYKTLALAPCSCLEKPTWWLKTAEVYLLPVLGARGLKSRCWQGRTACKGSGGGSSVLSQLLVAPGLQEGGFRGLWPHHSMSNSTSTWPSLCIVSFSVSYHDTCYSIQGPYGRPHLEIFNSATSARTLFTNNITGSRVRT